MQLKSETRHAKTFLWVRKPQRLCQRWERPNSTGVCRFLSQPTATLEEKGVWTSVSSRNIRLRLRLGSRSTWQVNVEKYDPKKNSLSEVSFIRASPLPLKVSMSITQSTKAQIFNGADPSPWKTHSMQYSSRNTMVRLAPRDRPRRIRCANNRCCTESTNIASYCYRRTKWLGKVDND